MSLTQRRETLSFGHNAYSEFNKSKVKQKPNTLT